MSDPKFNAFNRLTGKKRYKDRSVSYLVGEPDSDAEQDPADDEHGNVHGEPVERGAGKEDDAASEHGRPAAALLGDVAGEEGRDERGEVERRGEEGERHAVELAVLVRLHHLLLLGVHRREEALQEGVHGSHATCTHS
jgi:hypothetical protein